MDSCLGARGLFGHSSSSDAAFGSRQLEVIQDLDLYFIRQIARGLGVSRSGAGPPPSRRSVLLDAFFRMRTDPSPRFSCPTSGKGLGDARDAG